MTSAPAPIPFNRPALFGRELQYIAQAILQGHAAGDGPYTRQCQQLLEKTLEAPRVLLATSCTHALEMCALLLQLEPGDEVIVPSFTFVSTASAFAMRGARIVFADILPDTLNIDPAHLETLITGKTRAIVVVHYAGVGCAMDKIMPLAARAGIPVIEDNAHGLFGRYGGKLLGSFGCLATQSFHETKNITCGEGGALIVNDPKLIEEAEIIRDKGTNRSRYFRGQVDKYTWVGLGSSYVISDLLAAFLFAQLEAREQIMATRRRIWETYCQGLSAWAESHGIRLPFVPEECEQTYHMFYLVLPSLEARQNLIAHLASRGILAVFHYQPLHLSEYGSRWGAKPGDCPVTETIGDCLVRLPFYNQLEETDLTRIIDTVVEFRP